MKIIHISDTHIGSGNAVERFERIIDDIHQVTAGGGTWVLVHTGDLIDRAGAAEADTAIHLLNKLADGSGGGAIPLLLTPGNHDYGWSWHIDRDRAAEFRATFAPYIFGAAPAQFPTLRIIENCAFIGLDSSASEFGIIKGFFAEGDLGAEQRDRLETLLDDPALRGLTKVVYMHHHPFIDSYSVRPDLGDRHYFAKVYQWYGRSRLRLKDANSLLQVLRDRIDLLLFGHKHYGLDHCFEAKRYGIGMAFDASSTTAEGMDTTYMRYRVIDTDTGSVVVRLVRKP